MFGRRFGTMFPILPRLYNAFQKLTGGMPTPVRRGKIPVGQPQPAANLNLQPGDLVRVKSHEEILATITTLNTNRGLSFDNEMVPFCGGTYRVMDRVARFIDEKTGRLKTLKTPAVILQDVTCGSRFSKCRMFCPRSILGWWREIWLERVDEIGPERGRSGRRKVFLQTAEVRGRERFVETHSFCPAAVGQLPVRVFRWGRMASCQTRSGYPLAVIVARGVSPQSGSCLPATTG